MLAIAYRCRQPQADRSISRLAQDHRYTDNYGREPVAHLPNIEITGMKNPVIQVKDSEGKLVYALRDQEQLLPPSGV